MKIAVIGAAGNFGQRIVKEALNRGHSVTAVVRHPSKLTLQDAKLTVVTGDVVDPESVAQAVRGSDAVISTVGPNYTEGNFHMLVDAAHSLIAGLKKAGVKRLLVVGGAGSLEDAPGVLRMDMPDFNPAWRPAAKAAGDALQVYRGEKELDWTFLSPADQIGPGERTGHYRTGADKLIRDANGKSYITIEDYVVALLDEVEKPQHIKQRFTVAY